MAGAFEPQGSGGGVPWDTAVLSSCYSWDIPIHPQGINSKLAPKHLQHPGGQSKGHQRRYQNPCCIWAARLHWVLSEASGGPLSLSENRPACCLPRGDPSSRLPCSLLLSAPHSPRDRSALGTTQLGTDFPFMIVKENKESLSQ